MAGFCGGGVLCLTVWLIWWLTGKSPIQPGKHISTAGWAGWSEPGKGWTNIWDQRGHRMTQIRVWPHHWYQLLSHTTTDEFWAIIIFCSGGRADVRRGICGGRGGAPASVRLGRRRDPRRRRHQHWQQEQQGKLHQQQHWQGIKISTSWTKSVWHADFSNQNNIQFLNIKVLEVYDEETCMEMMRSYYEVKLLNHIGFCEMYVCWNFQHVLYNQC